MLLERTDEIADDLRKMGQRALNEASRAGVPAYFMDPRLGEGIIRRLPDGTLQRVELDDAGRDVLIEVLKPLP